MAKRLLGPALEENKRGPCKRYPVCFTDDCWCLGCVTRIFEQLDEAAKKYGYDSLRDYNAREAPNPHDAPTSRVVLWVHGCAFGDGSTEQDAQARAFMKKAGWAVIVPDFDRHSVTQAVEDIVKACNDTKPATTILVGISSGGGLAHCAAEVASVPAILICPVLEPATRQATLSDEQQTAQLRAFGSEAEMLQWEKDVPVPTTPRCVIVGTEDEKADPYAYHRRKWFVRKDLVEAFHFHTGHELCGKPPMDLIGEAALLMSMGKWPPKRKVMSSLSGKRKMTEATNKKQETKRKTIEQ